MPSIIVCPSCAGQLRLPEELIGQEVRCPTCSIVFTATVPAASPPPLPEHVAPPLDLSLGNGSGNGHKAEPGTAKPRGPVGAVEVKLSLADEQTGRPAPSRPLEPPLPKPPSRRDWPDEDHPIWNRRDREPNRGTLVLVLGILSLCTLVFWPVAPLGMILGLVAWVMGHKDRNKIKANRMDPDNSGLTNAGWICGIIGTLINMLWTLGCFGFVAMITMANQSRPAVRYTAPPVQVNPVPPNAPIGPALPKAPIAPAPPRPPKAPVAPAPPQPPT
jgi:hypothetical protein